MTKRNWFYTFGSAIATTIIILAIYWLNINKQYQNANSLHHIPSQTVCLVKMPSLAAYLAATDSVDFAHHIDELLFPALDSSELHQIKHILEPHPILANLLTRPIHLSYHATTKDSSMKALATIQLENPDEKAGLEQIMAPVIQEVIAGPNHTIQVLSLNGKHRIYSSISEGILFLSESEELIGQAIELPKKASISANTEFMDVYRTMSTTLPISLMIQPAMAEPMFNQLANTGQASPSLAKQARWIEMDLSLGQNTIQASGVVRAEENGFTNMVLKHSPSGTFSLDSAIPRNITKLMHYSKDRRGLANQYFTAYLKANNLYNKYVDNSTKLASRDSFPLEERLAQLFDAELAMYTINHNGKEENCLVVSIPDSAEYINQFKTVFSSGRESKANELTLSNGLTIPYYESRMKGDELFFLNTYFPGVPTEVYCQYNQTLLMAASPAVLEQNITSRLQNNTLPTRPGYQTVVTQLSSTQQFAFFSTSLLPTEGEATKQPASNAETALQNFGEAAFQLSTIHDLMYISMMVQYAPNRDKEMASVWQINPDTLLHLRPTRVVNHNTKADEIIFADKNNNLYLANNEGIVLWKKRIGNGIIGEIAQIDFFRNGKLQYMFNDTNHIFLIDRNGNHVAPFPIQLPVEATNGVACFDYDQDGNFRFVIAGQDRNIYAFNTQGERIKGFATPTTDQPIRNQIQHFRSSGKDYLVFQDGKKIYITDRRGSTRVTINSTIVPNAGSRFHLIRKNKKDAAIITTTNKNEWLKIHLATGETEVKSTLFEEKHDHLFLHIPSKNRFVMLLDGKILMINESGEVEFTNKSGATTMGEAMVLTTIQGQELVGYRDTLTQRVFLVNTNGVLLPGFPQQANSLPTVINQGEGHGIQMLITYKTDNIICATPMGIK